MAINKNYITVEYLLETYNSQHRGNYDDTTLQYYIDYASIRIENLTTNLVWDYDTTEQWRQDLYKYAIAVMTEHWLKQGNNLSLTDVSGTVGSISFSTSATNNVEYVPKLVLDLLIRAGAREHSSFDAGDDGVGPLNEYSPVFKTQQLLKDVSIEEGASDTLILLTKQRVVELLAGATGGEFQFATGEYLHDMNLIGDAADNFIYKQSAVDGLLIPITEDIARLFQEKANAADVYTKGVIDTQQLQQDNLIKANAQKANSNTTQINAIKQTLDQGGVAVESFLSINEATVGNTPIYSNSPVDVESNNDLILDNTIYIDELITTHDIKANGRLSIVVEGDIIRGNTNSLTTMRVSLMKYNDVNDYEFVKSIERAFDFTLQSTISGVSASIDHNVNADEKYFLQFETLEAGQTITFGAGAKFTANVYSSIGSGVISTSDDWINTSSIPGDTGTEALDWIQDGYYHLDAVKLTNIINSADERITMSLELTPDEQYDEFVDFSIFGNTYNTDQSELKNGIIRVRQFKYEVNGGVMTMWAQEGYDEILPESFTRKQYVDDAIDNASFADGEKVSDVNWDDKLDVERTFTSSTSGISATIDNSNAQASGSAYTETYLGQLTNIDNVATATTAGKIGIKVGTDGSIQATLRKVNGTGENVVGDVIDAYALTTKEYVDEAIALLTPKTNKGVN